MPSRRSEKRDTEPYRYLAIEIKRQQGKLFADGVPVRHFSVFSNIWDMDGQGPKSRLTAWSRPSPGVFLRIRLLQSPAIATPPYPIHVLRPD